MLTWSSNPETDLMGYRIYSGTQSGQYARPLIDAGNVVSYTVSGLSAGVTYYLALTAYDRAGNESAFSQEIVVTLADPGGGGGNPPGGGDPVTTVGGASGCGRVRDVQELRTPVQSLNTAIDLVVLFLPLALFRVGRSLQRRLWTLPQMKEMA